MVAKIKVTVTDDATVVLEGIPEALTPELSKAVLKAANIAGGEIVLAVRDTTAGSGTTTGALARSVLPAHFVEAPKGSVAAAADSDLIYAKIQDQGGTIHAKSVKNLAIPLTKEARGLWPRDRPAGELVFRKSKKGAALLVSATTGEPQYVLKPSVTLKGKGYIAKAREASEELVIETLNEAVDAAVEKAEKAAT